MMIESPPEGFDHLEWIVTSTDPKPWWKTYCEGSLGRKVEDGKLMQLVWVAKESPEQAS